MRKITRKLFKALPVALAMMACVPAGAQTTIFSSSDGARIPAITKLKDGTLMAVSDKRHSNYGDIGSNVIDLVTSTSSDNGSSWTDAATAVAGSSSASGFDYAHGDAAVVTDRESGEILMMCASGNVSFSNSKVIGKRSYSLSSLSYSYQLSLDNAIRIGRYVSSDNGSTWTGKDVTEDVYGLFDDAESASYSTDGSEAELSPSGLFFSSGRICQSSKIKVGNYHRIYAALVANPTSSCGVLVVYSDDFGETWNALGGSSALPCVGGDESKIEELPNGNVLLSSKYSTSRYFNIFTYSSTPTSSGEAEGSWGTTAASDINTTACNGEILIVPAKDASGNGVYVALQSVPASSSREKVSIYYKVLTAKTDYDEVSDFTSGWEIGKQVSSISSAYSTMTLDANGNIAFLYEENISSNGTYDIQFQSLKLSDIIVDGGYEYYADMTEDELAATTDQSNIDYWVGKVFTIKVHFNIDNRDSYYYLSCDYNETDQQPKFGFTSNEVTSFDKTYYWTLSKNVDDLDGDGTVEDHYYMSAIAGTGYWGIGKGIDYYRTNQEGTTVYSDNVPMCSEDYTKEFQIQGFEKSWTYSGKTPQTMEGIAIRFLHTTNESDRVVAFDTAGDINWLDHTSYGGAETQQGSYDWSSDFILDEVEYVDAEDETEQFGTVDEPTWSGFPVKMYRHADSYTAKDGENYKYYAMLKLSFATTLPDGVEAYKINSLSQTANTVVSLTKLELKDNVLPRETPVLLCMDGEQNDGDADCIKRIFLNMADAQEIISTTGFGGVLGKKVYKEGNDLYDSYIAEKKFYVLGKKNGRVAFYWLNYSNNQATVPANKGYYLYEGESQSALSFTFGDETTGIALPVAVENATDNDAPVYDLMGRRVSSPAKGIYIKGGKKYIVK